jgi:hypothetical protein
MPASPTDQLVTTREQLRAFSQHLAARRPAILEAWRRVTDADPAQTTAHALTRGQFNNHIPEVLDAFEAQLSAVPGGAAARAAASGQRAEEVKHGLHRWQQGYRLQELMREWGHLQLCLFEELQAFAHSHPEFHPDTLAQATRHIILLVSEAISASADQFERLQQAEAAGRLGDLEGALAHLNEIERRRSNLIHGVVHDLRNNLIGASMAADEIDGATPPDTERLEAKAVLNAACISTSAPRPPCRWNATAERSGDSSKTCSRMR